MRLQDSERVPRGHERLDLGVFLTFRHMHLNPQQLQPTPVPCNFISVNLFIILSHRYRSPERDSTLGLSMIAVFEDYRATALTIQPPQLDPNGL